MWGTRVWIYIVILIAIAAFVARKGLPKQPATKVEQGIDNEIILVE